MMIDVIRISRALSDPIRYKIMLLLLEHPGRELSCCTVGPGGACNCEIMEEFGMIQSRVSYHIKELTGAGLVVEQSQGKWKYYFLNLETLQKYTQQIGADFNL